MIERAAQDIWLTEKPPALSCLNLASHGFHLHFISLPEAKLARAPFPCIAWIEDQPSVLFSITKGRLAVLPEYGRVQFLWIIGWRSTRARLLLLQRGREAHNRKLGFSWFMPQIRKYKRSLAEVLLASLVLQY